VRSYKKSELINCLLRHFANAHAASDPTPAQIKAREWLPEAMLFPAVDPDTPTQADEGYGQFWGMRSGSGLVLGSDDRLAVAEADAAHDLSEAIGAVQPAPVSLGRPGELETRASAVFRDRQPLVLSVRRRTVANVLSTGFVLRTCFQCSAGKA
jgi:hypothetical protein